MWEANSLGNNAASDIEKARFCKKKLFDFAKYCLDAEPEPEPQ